jgi:hypothetical protein
MAGLSKTEKSIIGWFKPNQSTKTQILTTCNYNWSANQTELSISDTQVLLNQFYYDTSFVGRHWEQTYEHSSLGTDWRMIALTRNQNPLPSKPITYISIDGSELAAMEDVESPQDPHTYAQFSNFMLPSQGVQYADIGIYVGLLSDADIAEYRAALPMNPLNQSEWTTADTGLSPLCHYRFQPGDDLLKDGMGVSDLTLYGTGISATEHDDKHYLPPDYEPEPTPVPPETVPTINGCLFESALIIDEPDGETLRGESRYRIYLRAPSGD